MYVNLWKLPQQDFFNSSFVTFEDSLKELLKRFPVWRIYGDYMEGLDSHGKPSFVTIPLWDYTEDDRADAGYPIMVSPLGEYLFTKGSQYYDGEVGEFKTI